MRTYILLFACVLVIGTAFSVQAAVFNVSTTDDFQTALNTAATNGQDDTINVTAGTYTENPPTTPFPLTYAPGLTENKSLTIQGAGADTTILDGGGTSQILNINTTALPNDSNADITIRCIAFQNGYTTGDAGGLLVLTNKADITIEDLVFSGNSATIGVGAAYIISIVGGAVTLRNNTFSGNSATGSMGGAYIGSSLGSLTLTGNTFSDNSADSIGGAYIMSSVGTLTLTDNTFSGNSADAGDYGGACIMSTQGSIFMSNNTFSGNSAVAGDYGGAWIMTNLGALTLTGNTFSGNSADNYGGAWIMTSMGALTLTGNTFSGNSAVAGDYGGANIMCSAGTFFMSNNSFSGNSAVAGDYGGANIMCSAGTFFMSDNTFSGNSAGNDYGGAYISIISPSGASTISRNLFSDNSAANSYGGAKIEGAMGPLILTNNAFSGNSAVAGQYGGAYISWGVGALTLTNNTFYGNSAALNGGGVYVKIMDDISQAHIYNNISWGNTALAPGADIYVDDDGDTNTIGATVNLYNNNYHNFQIVDGDYFFSDNNIDQDPLLTPDLHLQGGSPCIDTGTNSAPGLPLFDFEGDFRVIDGDGDGEATVDMGADELSPGSIKIIKDAVPNHLQVFYFSGDLGPFSLRDYSGGDNMITFTDLPPGSYNVAETVPTGWALTGITCLDADGGSVVDLAAASATVDLDSGEAIICTFTNTLIPSAPTIRYTLSVNVDPAGTGSVTGNGISCPGDCSESYNEGTMVRLTANPAPGYTFDHWSGCSAPTNICDVIMNSNASVTAHFRESHRLEVEMLPSFGGTVSGDGIECPDDCREDYLAPTSITLTAQPDEGFILTGFEGCDSVLDSQCTVAVGSETAVRAIFAPESGLSLIYREVINIFSWDWLLYIPFLEEQLDGGGSDTYWLLLEYVRPEEYFRVVDYGPISAPVADFEVAQFAAEDSTWSIYIPGCQVEWDPEHPYWLTLEADLTDPNNIRVYVVDFGLAE